MKLPVALSIDFISYLFRLHVYLCLSRSIVARNERVSAVLSVCQANDDPTKYTAERFSVNPGERLPACRESI